MPTIKTSQFEKRIFLNGDESEAKIGSDDDEELDEESNIILIC